MADISTITLPSGDTYSFKDSESRKHQIYFGTCSTAAATQAKTVTIDGITELYVGLNLRIIFTYAQTYNGVPTLNVNSLGAKNIGRYSGTNAARYEWLANEALDLVYDGARFVIVDAGFATTTYYGVTKLYTGAASTSTALALTPASLHNLANGSIAPYYSASATYAVGDKVRYGNYLYECNTAITTAEAWTAIHWTQLDPLLTQIERLQGMIEGIFHIITPSFSSLPQTFYSSKLKATHIVVGNAVTLSNPKAGSNDWIVTFAAGSMTISGTYKDTTATTASMDICVPADTITVSSTQ